MNKILIVDDEKLIVKGLNFALTQDGYDVDAAYTGTEAIEMAREGNYDLILLDIMLPERNGFEVCQTIREFSDVPIIMLTARGEDLDKIMGFEYGADDYIAKPFNILEVKARMKAIMRRSRKPVEEKPPVPEKRIQYNDFLMDTEVRRVYVGEKEVSLTAKEFNLLELLVRNPRKVYSRKDLLEFVWGPKAYDGDERTVDVHVRRLREKLEPIPNAPRFIHTKWGVGYYFEAT